MKKLTIAFSFLAVLAFMICALPGLSNAAVSVEVAAIATGVEDHAPIGVGDSFPYTIEKLYCYTKITGGAEGDYVEHRWYHGDTLMATVSLTLGGPNWRTHSSKRIIRTWDGAWRVDIVSGGEVIKSLAFTIVAPEEPYSTEGSSEK